MFPAKDLVWSASWAVKRRAFSPHRPPPPKMTTAGLRGYLDTQKSEFLREVRTPLRFFLQELKPLTRALVDPSAPRAEPPPLQIMGKEEAAFLGHPTKFAAE